MVQRLQKGFTLIEIVLVIALIGITATLLVSLVNPVQQFKKSNDAKRKSDLHQIQAALELYRADKNSYPTELPDCGSDLTDGTITYMRNIPCDPKKTGQFKYSYDYDATAGTYSLITCLENLSDPQKDPVNDQLYCTDSTTGWSYTVFSP